MLKIDRTDTVENIASQFRCTVHSDNWQEILCVDPEGKRVTYHEPNEVVQKMARAGRFSTMLSEDVAEEAIVKAIVLQAEKIAAWVQQKPCIFHVDVPFDKVVGYTLSETGIRTDATWADVCFFREFPDRNEVWVRGVYPCSPKQ